MDINPSDTLGKKTLFDPKDLDLNNLKCIKADIFSNLTKITLF